MKIAKIREVKMPYRGTKRSAGIDFFVPEFNEKNIKDFNDKNPHLFFTKEGVTLAPQERILLPAGIKVDVPKGHALLVHNKSGVASKKGLDRLAEVIDCKYQGEVHVNLVNTSNDPVVIRENEKIVQMLLIPINFSMPNEVKLEDLYTEESERGEGGFGSTNNKKI